MSTVCSECHTSVCDHFIALRAQLATVTRERDAAVRLTAMWREAKCAACGQQCDPERDSGAGWLCDHCGPDTPLDRVQRERDALREFYASWEECRTHPDDRPPRR